MKRKNLLLGATAAAALAALNPAFAQDSQNVWSGVSASQSSPTVDQKASTSQSSTAESPVSRDSSAQGAASSESPARGSAGSPEGNASGGATVSSGRSSEDKATEHDKQGRDNGREKQGR